MTPTEHSSKTPSPRTGLFAMLSGLLDVKGSGAPKITKGVGASIAVVFALALLMPSLANAAFSRKFERQITEKTVGVPFNPGGVATDSANNLWVGNNLGVEGSHDRVLDEFEPASAGNKPIPLSPEFKVGGSPLSVAVESATAGNGDVYVALVGQHAVEVFNPTTEKQEKKLEAEVFAEPQVAVDNNPEADIADPSHCSGLPAECTVYVLSSVSGSSDLGGVEKFNSKLAPEPFTCGSTECKDYISGNRITGTPSDPTGGFNEQEGGVATDTAGDIYVASLRDEAVYEFKPTGEYEREINFQNPEVPRLCEVAGVPKGVAIDPVSGNLLVSLSVREDECGAVDEFGTEGPEAGKFVAQITETSAGAKLENLHGVSVDSLGDVYVVERTHPDDGVEVGQNAVDVWSPLGPPTPTVKLGQVSGRTETSAVLNGSVDPEGNPVGACRFQYVTEAAFDVTGFSKLESGGEAACSPEATKLKANSEYQPVEATITKNVVSGTTYDYRLLATTEGGGEAQSKPLAFTALAKPEIISTYTENLSSTFADLHAQIKPNGAATSYRFEYDTRPYVEGEGAHGASIPVPDEAIGAGGPTGGATESVLQHAGPLTAGTTYYYRVVASNTQGITTGAVCEGKAVGPDCTFTTLPAAVASERGYELVTPADKQGGSDMFAETIFNGLIENNIDVGAPAEDGEGFLLRTQSGFGAFPFAAFDEYVFKREPQKGGWSYTSLASPSLGVQGNKAVPLTSGDLSRVAVDDSVGSIAGEGVRVTSLIGSPGAPNPPCKGAFSLEDAFSAGCYIDLHEDAPLHSATEEIAAGVTEFVGGSQNLEHVVLDTPSRGLCPGVEGAAAKVTHGPVLCEWSGGELQLVNVAPGNEAQPASECGALLGLEAELTGDGLAHDAVSQDGSRVLFTAPDPKTAQKGNGCWNGQHGYGKGNEEEEVEPAKAKVPHELVGPKNAPQLYDRVETHEGGEVAHQVFKISEPEPELIEPGSKEPGTRPTAYPAIYVGASTNGSKVFFLTRTWMTKNHPEGHDSELYECEIVEKQNVEGETVHACELSRLSIPLHEKPEAEPGTPNPAGGSHVLSVPAVAAEGTAVYFTAFSTLAPGGTRDQLPGGGGEPKAEVNLYRYDTETQRTSYVSTVETVDYTGCGTGINAEEGFESSNDLCDDMNWYTTPDGRYLLFGASLKIEGYNAAANGCAERSLPRTQAVVDGRCTELYRYSAPAAERGEQAIVCVSCGSGGADAAGNAQFARSALEGPDSGPPRGMSNNGEYVFFDSQASLVPAASNGTLDTYQWREDLSTHARSISLVGLGTDTAPTYFLGYSPYEYTNSHGEKIKVEAGNVFIGTHAELSPVQTNSVGNIYDARACEEDSPCIKPPTGETAQCLGGECQKSPLAPSDPVATLLAPPGGGGLNPLAAPPPKKVTTKTVKCKKGLVRKKIKKKETCVKKPKKSKKAKKSNHGRAK